MTHDGKSVVVRKQTKKEVIRKLIERQRKSKMSL